MENISLYELNNKVKDQIQGSFPDLFWVIAEINEVNVNKTGHCYLELIEKDTSTDNIIAKARATIWAFTFRLLKPYFETTTGRPLSTGIKVLINVKIEFHEIFGYSLNIKDIDPVYTIGDLARQKQKTIEKLKEEGVFLMNKELAFPIFSSKIAIISSETSAGLEDFLHQLEDNLYNYKFITKLFPALMQGKEAVGSITEALDQIFQYESFFDIVIIIRGGGSQTDLSCFDNYTLASHIAQFPLPVLTGIGHEKDESVTDMVAFKSLKTPTAVAEFLISSYLNLENNTNEIQRLIIERIQEILIENRRNLEQISVQFAPMVNNAKHFQLRELNQIAFSARSVLERYLHLQKNRFKNLYSEFKFSIKDLLAGSVYQLTNIKKTTKYSVNQLTINQGHKLDLFERVTKLLDPDNILQRGYSISCFEGNVIKDAARLKKGHLLTTIFYHGKSVSKIEKISLRDKKK